GGPVGGARGARPGRLTRGRSAPRNGPMGTRRPLAGRRRSVRQLSEGADRMTRQRVVIMGAAGRDFHNFNTVFRGDRDVQVVAFTAAQIPGIADRLYPKELAGDAYPHGIPIRPEDELEALIRTEGVDSVVFAYSDVSHEPVM